MPDLKTQDGIADIGFAWMAWIIDPGKNALAIMRDQVLSGRRTTALPGLRRPVAQAVEGDGEHAVELLGLGGADHEDPLTSRTTSLNVTSGRTLRLPGPAPGEVLPRRRSRRGTA